MQCNGLLSAAIPLTWKSKQVVQIFTYTFGKTPSNSINVDKFSFLFQWTISEFYSLLYLSVSWSLWVNVIVLPFLKGCVALLLLLLCHYVAGKFWTKYIYQLKCFWLWEFEDTLKWRYLQILCVKTDEWWL